MASNDQAEGWKEVEKLLTKGKTQGALELLREIDVSGEHATTLRLAGEAVYMQASKSGSKSEYRKAAGLLRDSVNKNPRDKQANLLYNQLRNEMQDKSLSETVIPRLMNDGTPTPAGIFAVVAALLLIIGVIQISNVDTKYEDAEAIMNITWTDSNGFFHDENITIKLFRSEAPIHVENFILLADSGDYNNVTFHRIISKFMVQGGDFQYGSGSGGYAAKWYGYCNGETADSDGVTYTDETCSITQWSLPGEHTNGLRHGPGSLAAAHAGLNTDGSQFYFVPSDSSPCWLDGDQDSAGGEGACEEVENKDCSTKSCHTVYGEVIEGLEHIDAVSKVPVGGQGGSTPNNPVTMVSVTITDYGIAEDSWYVFW